ncbi:hypothetical protein RB653_006783 [Dictyostelium firmibasis]|uniref:RhoGAP domain-containing protein n=1 Tax=Dictyostelium firmibasis TaxID=79012 RepID=A0AAN7TV34_9MYCE
MSSSANSNPTNNKFKFSENLWDGFDLLVKRTDNDLIQSKNILNYFKKKAELEEQHSKKLEKLALKTLTTIDESTAINSISYNSSWKKIINSSMMESEQHTLLNTSILNKVIQPLQAMIKDMETKRKKILQEGIKLKQDMKEMVDELKKSQFKYDKAGKDLESSRMELREYRDQLQQQQQQQQNNNNSNGGQPSDSDINNISKIERRIQRCEQDFSYCDEEYREQIKATNDFQNLYNTEKLPKILNDFEHFIISHSHFSKSYFSSLVAVLIELPSSYQQNYEFVKKSVEMIDITNDLQEFIRKNIMKKQLAQPFQYEPYIEGKLTKKTISLTWNNKILSQFSRSSNNNNNSTNTSSGNLNPYIHGGSKKEEPILPTASFKVSLDELMNKQKDTHPTLEVPHVLQILANRIAELKGHVTEGIFRVPGIISTIKETRIRIDKGDFDLSKIDDVRTPAALFKQWLRDIPTALIPDSLYQQSIDTPTNAIAIIKTIPIINQRVLCYLINFLQIFTKFEFVAHSKMGTSNLAMVFAPCILRCTSLDANVMLNNVPNERLFVETLIKQIPPPLNKNEFLGLPISMSDAIKDSEDIEELNDLDQLSNNNDDDDSNGNGNTTTNTSNISIGSGTNISANYSNNSPNIDSPTTPSQFVVSTIETLPALNDDNNDSHSSSTGSPTSAPKPRPPRTQTLGWVRIKPAPKPSAEPIISLSSSTSQSQSSLSPLSPSPASSSPSPSPSPASSSLLTTVVPEKTTISPVATIPAATAPVTTTPVATTPVTTTKPTPVTTPETTIKPTTPPHGPTKSTIDLMRKLDQFTEETTPTTIITPTTTTEIIEKKTPTETSTSSPPVTSNISSDELLKKLDQFINF